MISNLTNPLEIGMFQRYTIWAVCLLRLHSSFDQPIGDWNVSGVSNMGHLLSGASSFNQQTERTGITKPHTIQLQT